MNRYELEVRAQCPANKKVLDVYQVVVVSRAMIEVEKLWSYFKQFEDEAIFQEELTRGAALAFPGAEVTTTGWHSCVKTTCTAP